MIEKRNFGCSTEIPAATVIHWDDATRRNPVQYHLPSITVDAPAPPARRTMSFTVADAQVLSLLFRLRRQPSVDGLHTHRSQLQRACVSLFSCFRFRPQSRFQISDCIGIGWLKVNYLATKSRGSLFSGHVHRGV